MEKQVVLVACKQDVAVTAWDLATGTLLVTYKQNASPCNALCTLGKDYWMAAQMKNRAIHFWAWHKDQVHQRSFLKEQLLCVAASACGKYIVGGAASGTVYCWDVGSGQLMREWHAHYKAVNALSFTSDGHMFLSGGDDSTLNCWLLMNVLDYSAHATSNSGRLQPFQSWSDHTLPITSIACGAGGIHGVVCSASLDRTCKIYSLVSGSVLQAFAFPASIHSLALDYGETSLFAGGGDGRIFQVQLGSTPEERETDVDGTDNSFSTLEGHTRTVTSLSSSPDGCSIVSGSEDGRVCVFDIRSRQVIRVINTHSKAPVSSVLVIQRPALMASGTRSMDAGVGGKSRRGPARPEPLASLSKYINTSKNAMWQGPMVILEGEGDVAI
eukprot:CAMPEP_0177773050 /NCGR_PEP_ID=MMETSP0491_2-20121128/12608_1 /TAXON_ID=63592 /ORGANISM="Tetraselmis chuii, Strain PLY429" /LENGTH=383 /DNA_ID=CAMNT_0019291019 /DNA_START=70 /DNA_END=1221 /DNA_ORIENTATION=-